MIPLEEKKFFYYYDKNDKSKKILTTIGQLNFLSGLLEKILEFVKDNLNDINKEMTVSNIKDKKK